MNNSSLGLVQIYTGPGKGKTTAALGLALRAVGHGFQVHIIQFLKGSSHAGELFAIQRLSPNISIAQYGRGCRYSSLIRQGKRRCTGCGKCFIRGGKPTEEEFEIAALAYQDSWQAAVSGQYDLLILDEIGNALRYNLVTVQQVLDLIKNKAEHTELVLTGRGIPEEVQAAADLVTELQSKKHPYQQGIGSRRGCEY